MLIKNFKLFCESISGTELMNVGGVFGPGYGEEKLSVSITSDDTNVVYSKLMDKFYTKDDWYEIYNEYLSKGGEQLDGFNQINLDTVLNFLSD